MWGNSPLFTGVFHEYCIVDGTCIVWAALERGRISPPACFNYWVRLIGSEGAPVGKFPLADECISRNQPFQTKLLHCWWLIYCMGCFGKWRISPPACFNYWVRLIGEGAVREIPPCSHFHQHHYCLEYLGKPNSLTQIVHPSSPPLMNLTTYP